MTCIALSAKDRYFKCSRVKLELVYQDLYYLNEKGEEFICTDPLKEINLVDTVTNASYYFVHSSFVPALAGLPKGWYQHLVRGKVSLYRSIIKVINENAPYSSAVTEQRIRTSESYLLAYNGTVLKGKKPKDLPALLTDGKTELEIFLKSDEMKAGSTAEQMTAMVNHYNALQ